MNLKKLTSILLFGSLVNGQDFSQPLDTSAYLGKWYQVYSDKFVQSTFEKDAKCVFSIYGLNNNNTISVYNQQLNQQNQKQSINGYAFTPNDNYPRKLAVNLNGGMGDAPYWIYSLGPIINDLYEYAIVSDQYKVGLFVLARDVDTFMDKYNDDVLSELNQLGFTTFLNKPILTDQSNCPDQKFLR
jgi:lipocalin